LPAAELLEQVVGEGCESEGADSGAADGDSGGERTLGLKVVADGHYGGQVDEAEADSAHHAVRQHQYRHVRRQRRKRERNARQHRARDANCPTPKFVGQRGHEWT